MQSSTSTQVKTLDVSSLTAGDIQKLENPVVKAALSRIKERINSEKQDPQAAQHVNHPSHTNGNVHLSPGTGYLKVTE